MIIVYHSNNKITEVVTGTGEAIPFGKKNPISLGLYLLAEQFPNVIILWCHDNCRDSVDFELVNVLFHHNKMMLSYRPGQTIFFTNSIGYVEDSPFIKINKKVTYPTWQMSSYVGVIHASVLNALQGKIKPDADLDYFLSSVAKLCMPEGLLCYSEPGLLKSDGEAVLSQTGMNKLFRFVYQHYRTHWIFLLLLNLFLYERKFPFVPFLNSFFYKKRSSTNIDLESVKVRSFKKVIDKGTIDVVIPTIGRKKYLYDVLKDFAQQTVRPTKIIIVEQNQDLSSQSELDYLQNENWPFEIRHFFIHQAGACNARNLALAQVESEWVFLADDDIRFKSNLIENVLHKIDKFGTEALLIACPQELEEIEEVKIHQTTIFGSGNSFFKAKYLKEVVFDMVYEFGYGEDIDFGLQLRNSGCDILYFPHPQLIHLKAPVGGFRIKFVFPWSKEKLQPKPSPSIMYLNQKYFSSQQINRNKTLLFLKMHKFNLFKLPIFLKRWKQSGSWASKLKCNG